MSYQTSSKRSPPFWLLIVPEKHNISGTNQKPERQRPFGTGLVRHCPQGLFSPFFTFLRAIYFSARLDFFSSPLSAPGSPRMFGTGLVRHCPQGLFSPFFTFLRAIYFSARLDFSSSPLSAPGSPRMTFGQL